VFSPVRVRVWQQRSVEERVSDLEKRVSALEKPSPLEPNQASEETKADTQAKPTPEAGESTARHQPGPKDNRFNPHQA
jgi:hypothetical protein